MPRRRDDLLYDFSLVVASASTAVGVYWSLLQIQRKYWRYRVSPSMLVLLALCLLCPFAHCASGWAPASPPSPPPGTPPPPPDNAGAATPPSFFHHPDATPQGKAKARIPMVLLQSEWSKAIQVATEAALQAGHNIRVAQERESNRNVQYKGDIDLVTETDKANEKLVMELLKSNFPEHQFIGEEEASAAGTIPPLTAAPTWIVDPVDGTTNFVHAFPFSCVALALAVGKEVVVGVVYDPAKDELFLAAKGKGAYCNGKRLKASGCTELGKAVVIQEFGYERSAQGIAKLLAATERLLKTNVQAVRQLGSGVLDLAYVAAGRVDAVYCGVAGEGWKPWDYAAGSILATEAGAVMTNARGADFDLYDSSMVCAANEALARKIVGIFKD